MVIRLNAGMGNSAKKRRDGKPLGITTLTSRGI